MIRSFKAILGTKLLTPRLACCAQKAGLKATYGDKYPYAEAFPYDKKKYNVWRSMFDQTLHRFNENSKIIVVEGNIGVGKAEFAKRLANGFDMKYFGPVGDESCFLEPNYGFDMRKLNCFYPPNCGFYDLMDFYKDEHPERGTAGKLAIQWYAEKYHSYALALKHLLNTGQGVVMATSVYSDMVFVSALKQLSWCSRQFLEYYEDYRSNSICELHKPHLTIYLDAPLDVVKKRISENKPDFKDCRNLNDKYLKAIEDSYKNLYLPFARKHGEVVEIDWTEKANQVDMDTISEELQLLRLDADDLDDTKFNDWSRSHDDDLLKLRQMVDTPDNYSWLLDREDPVMCDELTPTPDQQVFIDRLHREHPVLRGVPPGFSEEFGHKTMFK